MGYGQYKALLPQKVPVVIQSLTTVNILLLPLRRKVWRHETRTVDFTLLWAKRQSAVITRRRQNCPGPLSIMVTPASADEIQSSHPGTCSTWSRKHSYQRPHPSSTCILPSLMAKDKGAFLLSLQGTRIFSTPWYYPLERDGVFCHSKQENMKAVPQIS